MTKESEYKQFLDTASKEIFGKTLTTLTDGEKNAFKVNLLVRRLVKHFDRKIYNDLLKRVDLA